MIYHFQSGGNPEAENDAKETPLEVADEPETRRLLLEGIFFWIIMWLLKTVFCVILTSKCNYALLLAWFLNKFLGIPIYKQFEKRRKAERERRKREEEDKREDT